MGRLVEGIEKGGGGFEKNMEDEYVEGVIGD